jgi:hypothetical protein
MVMQIVTDLSEGPADNYCIHLDVDYVTHLLSEDPPIYRNFFDWMLKTFKEKRLQSYDDYWRRLINRVLLPACSPSN